jgi:hypothetical protein
VAPPAGFEPALTAPEAVALSPELWGLCDTKGYQPLTRAGTASSLTLHVIQIPPQHSQASHLYAVRMIVVAL